MAIYITQTSDEVQHSFAVQIHSEIVGIRLKHASVTSDAPPNANAPGLQFHVGHKSIADPVVDRTLLITVDCGLWATSESSDQKPVLVIQTIFEAKYEFQSGFSPTAEQIAAFASGNAVFNVWPFFREFAQSAAVRMGYQGEPTIPFLRLISSTPAAPSGQNARSPSRKKTSRKSK